MNPYEDLRDDVRCEFYGLYESACGHCRNGGRPLPVAVIPNDLG